MKKLIPTIPLLLCCLISFTQQKNNNSKTYYVLNEFGTELYLKPTFNSEVLTKIKAGEKLVSSQKIKTEESKYIGTNFSLEGEFLKITNDSLTGYVFSADLTQIKPKMVKVYDEIFIPNILGKELTSYKKTHISTFGGKDYEITDEITEYENGTYTYTAFDSCFDHVYHYRNLSFNEAYHEALTHSIIINESGDNSPSIEPPVFIEKSGNEYRFESDGATEDLKLIINEDGTFTVSSYDCT